LAFLTRSSRILGGTVEATLIPTTRTLPAIAVFAFTAIATLSASADDDRLMGIAMTPARDRGVAWSRRSIESLDGRRVVLPGAGQVAAVAVGADGTVFAIRARSRFGVAGPGAAAVWRDAPIAGKTRGLVLIANRVAWIVDAGGGDKLALTADQGRHWNVQNLPHVDHGRLRLLADGVIELVGYMEDCHSGDYSVVYHGRVGSNRWREIRTGAETEFGEPTHFGSWMGEGDQPIGSDGFLQGFEIEPAHVDGDGKHQPPRLVSHRGGDREPRVLDAHVPEGLTLMTSDAEGRPLGVTKDNVWRWSRASGWQALWRPPR
jgi:hypothetical protein